MDSTKRVLYTCADVLREALVEPLGLLAVRAARARASSEISAAQEVGSG
jgi:hypothetical protein